MEYSHGGNENQTLFCYLDCSLAMQELKWVNRMQAGQDWGTGERETDYSATSYAKK